MSAQTKSPVDIAAAAQRLLGFKSLRPGQREAIQALFDGRDTLLVQPTGSGKSAVYQIAGSLLAGSTWRYFRAALQNRRGPGEHGGFAGARRGAHSNRDAASLLDLSRNAGLSQRKILNLFHKLEEVGISEKLASGQIRLTRTKSPTEMIEAVRERDEFLKALRRRRLDQVQQHAESRGCRREFLLRYFGDNFTGPCGSCDYCESNPALAAAG